MIIFFCGVLLMWQCFRILQKEYKKDHKEMLKEIKVEKEETLSLTETKC